MFEHFKRNLNVRYLHIVGLTEKQTVVKCNKDDFKIRQLNCMIFAKRWSFMLRLYPVRKNKILHVMRFCHAELC